MINNYPIITLCGSTRFKGYDFENFVANILNAMGYRTKVSKQGGDSGIGIVAYKDEFPPRICVQVKSIDNGRYRSWEYCYGKNNMNQSVDF